MTDDERSYHLAVRALTRETAGPNPHTHHASAWRSNTQSTYADCLDMSDDALPRYRFETSHDEGYAYSSYTWDSAHTTLTLRFPMTCQTEGTWELASDDDFTGYDFGGLIRKLMTVDTAQEDALTDG